MRKAIFGLIAMASMGCQQIVVENDNYLAVRHDSYGIMGLETSIWEKHDGGGNKSIESLRIKINGEEVAAYFDYDSDGFVDCLNYHDGTGTLCRDNSNNDWFREADIVFFQKRNSLIKYAELEGRVRDWMKRVP